MNEEGSKPRRHKTLHGRGAPSLGESSETDLTVVKMIFGQGWAIQNLPDPLPADPLDLYRSAWLAYMQGRISMLPSVLSRLDEGIYRRTLDALYLLTLNRPRMQ